MNRFKATPGFVLMLSVLYYLSPDWLFWDFVLCAGVHELCHAAALGLWDVKITGLSLGAFGAVLDTAPMSFYQEIVCALAGPFGNLMLFWLLWKPVSRLAMVSLGLAMYNLLPIYPLDGGRALRAVLGMYLPVQLCSLIEWGIAGIVLVGLVILIPKNRLGFGVLLLLLFRVLPTGDLRTIIKRKCS